MNAADRLIVNAIAALLCQAIENLGMTESLRCAAHIWFVALRAVAGLGPSGKRRIAGALREPVAAALRNELPTLTQAQAEALAGPLSRDLAQRMPPQALNGPALPPLTPPRRVRWDDEDLAPAADDEPAFTGTLARWRPRR